jgi:hypothetical protein
MLTNTQTQPTQALAVPEPTAPAIVEQRPTTALGKWQRLDAMTQMKFADFLADAPIIPKPYRKQPGNVYVAAEMGAVLGWGPIEAMQNIDVIEGTPSLKAEAMRALIKAAGHRLTVPESSAESCTVLIERNDTLGDAQVTYTIEDGRRAGLAGKDVWKKHPARMLLARATTNAATIACPEVLRGMHFLDEGGGDPIEAGVPANPVEALQATTEAVAAIEAPEPAPEPAKKASKPAEAPQAAARARGRRDRARRARAGRRAHPGHPRQRRRQQRLAQRRRMARTPQRARPQPQRHRRRRQRTRVRVRRQLRQARHA